MYETALALSVLMFLLVCGYYWRSPAFSVFHPLTFYLAFHGLLFVFRPILAWVRGYEGIYRTYQFMPSLAEKTTTILAATAGLLAFSFFCLRAGAGAMRFAEDGAIREERRRLSQIFVWVLLICGPPAAYSMVSSFGADNNFTGMTLDQATGVTINTVKVGYFTDLQLMAVSLCALVVWLSRFRLWSFVPIAAFILLRAGTGGRGPFVSSIVTAGLFYLYEKRIRYPGIRVILGGAVLLAFFSFVGNDRGSAIGQAIGLNEVDSFEKAESSDRFLEGMDFGNMEYFEYLVHAIPQRSGTYDYFLDNVQVLTEPIPRILWPAKPVGEPLRRIWLFDYGYPIGMTKSLPGEGWYALGWLGVLIWCGLWGHVLGRIYARFIGGSQTTFKTACYMIFLPILIVALRDGILLTAVRQAGVYLAPVFVWYVIAKYTGIPSAAQLRASLLPGRAVDPMRGPGQQPSRLPGPAEPLPPAVARRRAAVRQQSASTPAE